MDMKVWANGFDHPESVAVDAKGGVYTGGEAGQLYRVADDGTFEQIGSTGGFVLGLAVDGEGNIYACDLYRKELVRRDASTGETTVASSGADGVPFRTPNYPAFGADGTIYVTDSGEWQENDGALFAVRPSGQTVVWSESVVGFPNACAVTPAGDALIVVESTRPGLTRVPIHEDGAAGEPESIVTFDANIVPDGLALCADGSFVVSCYRPDVIFHVTADGRAIELARDELGVLLAAPTDVAFAGRDRDQLVIANLGRWHLTRATTDLRGVAPHLPTLVR